MSWVQLWCFGSPVSGTTRKHFRISGPVSCLGFSLQFPGSVSKPFAGVLRFHSLFRVLCLGLRFRLGFYV